MTDHVVSATVRIAAPAERIWEAITDPEALAQWYAPGCRWEVAELRAGETMRFFNSDTEVQSAVIERCIPPAELVLRWTPDASLPETQLVNSYTIRRIGDECEVRLWQTGYASVPTDQRASWIRTDEGAFPAIAAALAAYGTPPRMTPAIRRRPLKRGVYFLGLFLTMKSVSESRYSSGARPAMYDDKWPRFLRITR